MRMFIVLLGVAGLSFSSLGAERAQNPIVKKPADAVEQPRQRSRCAKKIVLGADKSVVACLMRKRKELTESDEERRATGSARDETTQTKRGASPSSSKRAPPATSSSPRASSHGGRRHGSH